MSPYNYEPFIGPKLKLARALHHVDELGRCIDAYSRDVKLTFEPVGDGSCGRWKVCVSLPPPAEMPFLLGDAIHNMRSALDIMMCDIARVRGIKTNGITFPIKRSPDFAREIINSKLKLLGNDVVVALHAIVHDISGDSDLNFLHDLDIADKHSIIIPLVTFMSVEATNQYAIDGFIQLCEKNGDDSTPHLFQIQNMISAQPSVALKVGEIFHLKPGNSPRLYFIEGKGLQVGIPAADGSWAGEAVSTLESFAKIVDKLLDSFSAQFGGPSS